MKRIIKLSQWAKEKDIHYQTAHRKFKKGEIKGSFKNKKGLIFVEVDFIECPNCKHQIAEE